MKTIQMLGVIMMAMLLVSGIVSLLGIWGFMPGETAFQVIFSAGVVGGCVLGTNEVLKNFFPDKLK